MSKVILKGTILTAMMPEEGVSQRTGNQWKKQVFIMETSTNANYSNKVAVTAFRQDMIDKFLAFPPGSNVEVEAFVESRASQTGRWFTEVTASDIRQAIPDQPQQMQPQPMNTAPYPPQQTQTQQFQSNAQKFAEQYQQGMQNPFQPQENYELPF